MPAEGRPRGLVECRRSLLPFFLLLESDRRFHENLEGGHQAHMLRPGVGLLDDRSDRISCEPSELFALQRDTGHPTPHVRNRYLGRRGAMTPIDAFDINMG